MASEPTNALRGDASERQDAVTCHRCGAPVEADALTVQTMADGTPILPVFYCRAHLIAGTKRLKAALRAERERAQREGGA